MCSRVDCCFWFGLPVSICIVLIRSLFICRSGSCGNVCPQGANVFIAQCLSGSCDIVCDAGWADCDGDIWNGCETQLGTNDNWYHICLCSRADLTSLRCAALHAATRAPRGTMSAAKATSAFNTPSKQRSQTNSAAALPALIVQFSTCSCYHVITSCRDRFLFHRPPSTSMRKTFVPTVTIASNSKLRIALWASRFEENLN